MAADPSNATVSNSTKKKVSILPAISENAADWIYLVGNLLVLLAAVAGTFGAVGVFWGDRVRDHFNDLRLSDNERKTAEANERAAALNDRATKSELEFEKLKTPRIEKLLKGKIEELLKGKPTGTCMVWYIPENEEAQILAIAMTGSLVGAGWKTVLPMPIPTIPSNQSLLGNTLFTRASGGAVTRSGIVLRCSTLTQWRDANSPIAALSEALEKVGLPAQIVPEELAENLGLHDPIAHALSKDEVLIVIGNKYQ